MCVSIHVSDCRFELRRCSTLRLDIISWGLQSLHDISECEARVSEVNCLLRLVLGCVEVCCSLAMRF